MKKYKLINRKTKEEHICNKVTIDGFDYYVSDECDDLGGWHIDLEFNMLSNLSRYNVVDAMKKVIATTNPSIDVPKVVDEVEELADNTVKNHPANRSLNEDGWMSTGFVYGYNKTKETYKFTEEDMIEFSDWKSEKIKEFDKWILNGQKMGEKFTTKELLQLWQEQRTETIYFE